MWKLFNHYTRSFSFSLGTLVGFILCALLTGFLNVVCAMLCCSGFCGLVGMYVFLFGLACLFFLKGFG